MRHNWYCVTDLPNREEAPAAKPSGLIRENDEFVLATNTRAVESVVNPYDPSKYWDFFGGTD